MDLLVVLFELHGKVVHLDPAIGDTPTLEAVVRRKSILYSAAQNWVCWVGSGHPLILNVDLLRFDVCRPRDVILLDEVQLRQHSVLDLQIRLRITGRSDDQGWDPPCLIPQLAEL